MQETNNPALRRCFGMREAVTITAGSVIGVGLFTVGSNIVGSMGSSVIFATLAALLISIYPALLYAEARTSLLRSALGAQRAFWRAGTSSFRLWL